MAENEPKHDEHIISLDKDNDGYMIGEDGKIIVVRPDWRLSSANLPSPEDKHGDSEKGQS